MVTLAALSLLFETMMIHSDDTQTVFLDNGDGTH